MSSRCSRPCLETKIHSNGYDLDGHLTTAFNHGCSDPELKTGFIAANLEIQDLWASPAYFPANNETEKTVDEPFVKV
jgi:hypothetical protein